MREMVREAWGRGREMEDGEKECVRAHRNVNYKIRQSACFVEVDGFVSATLTC